MIFGGLYFRFLLSSRFTTCDKIIPDGPAYALIALGFVGIDGLSPRGFYFRLHDRRFLQFFGLCLAVGMGLECKVSLASVFSSFFDKYYRDCVRFWAGDNFNRTMIAKNKSEIFIGNPIRAIFGAWGCPRFLFPLPLLPMILII